MGQVISLQFHEQTVRNLAQMDDHRMIQLSLEQGKGIEGYRSNRPIVVIVLSGRLQLTFLEKTFVLGSNELMTLEPLQVHTLYALERTTVLLCLMARVTDGQGVSAIEHRDRIELPYIDNNGIIN